MPIIDFHLHAAQPEHYHPWVVEWMQTFVEQDFLEHIGDLLTPEGVQQVLRASGVDYGVVLAEISPIMN